MIEQSGEMNHKEPDTAVRMSFGKWESRGSHMGGHGHRYRVNCSSDCVRQQAECVDGGDTVHIGHGSGHGVSIVSVTEEAGLLLRVRSEWRCWKFEETL